MRLFLLFLSVCTSFAAFAQNNIVAYAGGSGSETFYDVAQLSDGTILVAGYAQDLNWVPLNVPRTVLPTTGINNGQGTNKYGFLLHLSADLQTQLHLVHFPQNGVEDIRFVKFTNRPGEPTEDIYISGNTADTEANDGGYFIARLNNNFVNGVPTGFGYTRRVWAVNGQYPQTYHPWDVDGQGRVVYISGESHAYDWSAVYALDYNGNRRVMEHWRTHWLNAGGEWKGTPASSYPNGGLNAIGWSGIVLKFWGRCDLRSWTPQEFNNIYPDGNGGTKKGRWPMDFLFSSECNNANINQNGPGYNGYSPTPTPVWGGSCVVSDKRNGDFYIGMNTKTTTPAAIPDFEPAVIKFDENGQMMWWSRLYHEITPQGDTVISEPDQYVDALGIDYLNNYLVVGARTHGNNTENYWEGNTVAANPNAQGFQNRFTGTNGNIHESWLGKLRIADGTLMHSTYMAELAEGTGGLGAAHPDPNLDGWPDPNQGWPDVNSTFLAKNALKVTADGSVLVMAKGRRTITTANAYQKMPKPFWGAQSAWNSFVRVYAPELNKPLYSSLVVGVWDTTNQQGGDNTDLFGCFKTQNGVLAVGRQKATNGLPNGNPIPVTNVPAWAANAPQGESAIIVWYRANNLNNPLDNPVPTGLAQPTVRNADLIVQPNPNDGSFLVKANLDGPVLLEIFDNSGRLVSSQQVSTLPAPVAVQGPAGVYVLRVTGAEGSAVAKVLVKN